jgi:hypothetical protein
MGDINSDGGILADFQGGATSSIDGSRFEVV